MKATFLAFIIGAALSAQQPHTVTLTWQDTANPAGTTYSVYRSTGLCTGNPTFSKLAEGIAVKTYVDTTVSAGNYCFTVTANFNGVESPQSNTALAPVPTFAPTSLTVAIDQPQGAVIQRVPVRVK